MEKILIDGYNLLHKDGVLKNRAERSLEDAREQLIAQVSGYRSGDMEIVLVFDGRGGDGKGRRAVAPGVEVRFSSYPQSADQLILEIIEQESRRNRLTVVTSDRKDIGKAARAEGVRWISSESFLRRLRRTSGRSVDSTEKPAVASSEEMDYWMKRFGSGEAGTEEVPPRSPDSSGSSPPRKRPSPISPKRRTSR